MKVSRIPDDEEQAANERRHRRAEWSISVLAAIAIIGAAYCVYQFGTLLIDALLDLIFPVSNQ